DRPAAGRPRSYEDGEHAHGRRRWLGAHRRCRRGRHRGGRRHAGRDHAGRVGDRVAQRRGAGTDRGTASPPGPAMIVTPPAGRHRLGGPHALASERDGYEALDVTAAAVSTCTYGAIFWVQMTELLGRGVSRQRGIGPSGWRNVTSPHCASDAPT